MKISRIAGVALALAALFPVAVLAQEAGAEKKKGPPANAFMGAIKSVDATAKTITIENKKTSETKTFAVTDKTKIKIDGADKTLADLTEGLRVSVVPNKKGDAAQSISGKTAAAKGGGKKKAAAQ